MGPEESPCWGLQQQRLILVEFVALKFEAGQRNTLKLKKKNTAAYAIK
jgi:hypothetical protein